MSNISYPENLIKDIDNKKYPVSAVKEIEIDRALNYLPDNGIKVLRLYYKWDQSKAEISRALGLTKTRITAILNKSLRQLRGLNLEHIIYCNDGKSTDDLLRDDLSVLYELKTMTINALVRHGFRSLEEVREFMYNNPCENLWYKDIRNLGAHGAKDVETLLKSL